MWDMPITVSLPGIADEEAARGIYAYFSEVDNRFSTFKASSEISQINRGELPQDRWSKDMHDVMSLCADTERQTGGYFSYTHSGYIDPLGVVKGWAVQRAADMLLARGIHDFYIDAGGDIAVHGANQHGVPWRVGIRNPFARDQIVKRLILTDAGIATSGTYIRGQHIVNPFAPRTRLTDIVSLTVVGPNVAEADRFATAAFAMGRRGIFFIESLPGFEGYQIDSQGKAMATSGLGQFLCMP